MKYLCLVYTSEDLLHTHPDSPEDTECWSYAEKLEKDGNLVAGQALEPVRTASTVRVRGGQVSVTDGPFAETKEQLAGFYLVEAESRDEAIRIASGIPPARVGSIEVRPVRQLNV